MGEIARAKARVDFLTKICWIICMKTAESEVQSVSEHMGKAKCDKTNSYLAVMGVMGL